MVFGRLPEPGRAKTRLAPALGEKGAAALYGAFLADTLELCRGVEAELELWVPRRPGARSVLRRRHPDLRIRGQPEGGLGERLRAAFDSAFGAGSARALVVGSDHPTLPRRHVEEAFEALGRADVCFGPTPDGGYWAAGVRRDAWPGAGELFDDVPWSTPHVLRATLDRAAEAGLEAHRVSTWYDVDEPRDLDRLRGDVRPGSATARALKRLEETGGG